MKLGLLIAACLLAGCVSPRQNVDVTKVLKGYTNTAIYATVNATYPQGITYAPRGQTPQVEMQALPPEVIAELIKAGVDIFNRTTDNWAGVRKEVVTYDMELLILGDIGSNALRTVERAIRLPIEADRPNYLYPGASTNGP